MTNYTDMGASFSADGKYRYLLWREWRGSATDKNWRWFGAKDGAGEPLGEPKSCLFVMLNPSTADGEQDDPTIRRCVGFAKALKFDRMEVVNLFAYRATDPRQLLALSRHDDPVGCGNHEIAGEAARDAGMIICAWGAHGSHLGQDETMLGWLNAPRKTFALKLTKDGRPCHPLYLPANCRPFPYDGAP